MSNDTSLEKLRRDVQYLMDRQAILDCIARHARGCDRHDVDLLTSTYHEDGTDEHGYAINQGPKYAEWANAIHAAGSTLHTHNITTHLCEIDGDVAHCETYVIVGLLNNDQKGARLISGRYIDRLKARLYRRHSRSDGCELCTSRKAVPQNYRPVTAVRRFQ